MSDLKKLKNERERLLKKYEHSSNMLNTHIELTKFYNEICKKIDQSIVEIDQSIHTINNKKSPS